MFLITLSSGFFYTSPLITSVKCFSCLTMVKIVSLIVLLFCYKMSAAVRSQTSGEAGSGFNRAGKKIQCRSLQLMFYSLQCLWRLRAKLKNWGFNRKPALLRGTESRQKAVGMSLFCLPAGPNSGGRGSESRQKTEELLLFCLPDTSKSTRAASKVDKKRGEWLFFVYRLVQIQGARIWK